MLQAKKTVSKKLNYDSISSIFDRPKKRKKKAGKDGAREGTQGDGSAYFASDAEPSEPEVVEEDGQELPSAHPDKRRKSREEQKQKKNRERSKSKGSATGDATSSAGEESEAPVGDTLENQTDGEGGETDGVVDEWQQLMRNQKQKQYEDEDHWDGAVEEFE